MTGIKGDLSPLWRIAKAAVSGLVLRHGDVLPALVLMGHGQRAEIARGKMAPSQAHKREWLLYVAGMRAVTLCKAMTALLRAAEALNESIDELAKQVRAEEDHGGDKADRNRG